MFRVKCFSTRRLYAQIAMLASLLVVGGAASAATSATFEHDHGTVRLISGARLGRGRTLDLGLQFLMKPGCRLAVARRCRFSTRGKLGWSTNFAHAKMMAGLSTFRS